MPQTEELIRLYPPADRRVALDGLYLAHGLHRCTETPFVYTNFITSLDGRIAELDPASGLKRLPSSIVNAHDWHLFQELAAQADVLLTTTRHLKAVAAGRHDAYLALPDALRRWRRCNGLAEQPHCAAVGRPDFDATAVRRRFATPLLMLVTARTDAGVVRTLRQADIDVVTAGPGPHLSGEEIVAALVQRGYQRIYSIAGPRVMHSLLEANAVDRLYLTIALRILGGEGMDSLCTGPALPAARAFVVHEMYLDNAPPQLFVTFDRRH